MAPTPIIAFCILLQSTFCIIKIDDGTSGRAFRRQFLPISQKPTILERRSRIFVNAQERKAPDEVPIRRPFRYFSFLFIFYRPLPRQNTYFIFGFSLSQNLVQFSSLSQTHFFVSHFSALYNHQGRDAHYTVLNCQVPLFIDVELAHLYIVTIIG